MFGNKMFGIQPVELVHPVHAVHAVQPVHLVLVEKLILSNMPPTAREAEEMRDEEKRDEDMKAMKIYRKVDKHIFARRNRTRFPTSLSVIPEFG